MIPIEHGISSVTSMDHMLTNIYPWIIAIISPLVYLPFVYFIFKDMDAVKEITIRIYIILLVSNILNILFYGANVTPF